MNPSLKRASNPGPVPDESEHQIPIRVTQSLMKILILGSMRIGPSGNLYPAEIQVKTNNLIEVSTERVKRKCTHCTPEKLFKYFIFLVTLMFLLIMVITLGLKHSGQTETVKECLPGHYMFPYCKSK